MLQFFGIILTLGMSFVIKQFSILTANICVTAFLLIGTIMTGAALHGALFLHYSCSMLLHVFLGFISADLRRQRAHEEVHAQNGINASSRKVQSKARLSSVSSLLGHSPEFVSRRTTYNSIE